MVSELLKRSEDFHISALKGPMRNEKQEGKSRKAFFFCYKSRCKRTCT